MQIKKIFNDVLNFFADEDSDPQEPAYDPAHVAVMIVLVILGLALLFWLLWALVVCEGGIFIKIIPFLQVVFTSKTLQDFGFEGYPYELGIFEGWIINVVALVLFIGLLAGISSIFRNLDKKIKNQKLKSKI